MERSGSQKTLLVLSIINIVFGALAILLGLLSGAAGIGVGSIGSSQLAEAGLTSSDAQLAAGGLGFIGIVIIVGGIINLVEGILGVRAANDNQKIMPVWVLAIIGLVLSCVSLIISLVQGSFNFSSIAGLILPGITFWIANNIKQEAGK